MQYSAGMARSATDCKCAVICEVTWYKLVSFCVRHHIYTLNMAPVSPNLTKSRAQFTKFKVSPQKLHFCNFQFKARSHSNGVFIVRNRLVSCTAPSQAPQTWRTHKEHHLKHRTQSIIGIFTQSFWLGIPTLFPLLDVDFCFGYSFIDWLAVFNCVEEL